MRLIRGSELTDSDLTDFPVSTAIPIAQALPPIALRVLAWTGHRWTVATRHSRWIDGVTGHIIEPTHWQHLPAAPQ